MSKTERPSRRAALLGDRPGSYAIARHVRMSASKCRRVINLVRGMDAVDAVTMLKFQPQAAAEPIRKVIASAMSNAEQTEGLRADDLYISQAFVDEGVTMRFGSKVPGSTMEVRDVNMDFAYAEAFTEVADIIGTALVQGKNADVEALRARVDKIAQHYPLYEGLEDWKLV